MTAKLLHVISLNGQSTRYNMLAIATMTYCPCTEKRTLRTASLLERKKTGIARQMPSEQEHSSHLRFIAFFSLYRLNSIGNSRQKKNSNNFLYRPEKKAIRESEMQCSRKLSLSLKLPTSYNTLNTRFILSFLTYAQKVARINWAIWLLRAILSLVHWTKKSLRLHQHGYRYVRSLRPIDSINASFFFRSEFSLFFFRSKLSLFFCKRYNTFCFDWRTGRRAH